ncbi:hypothetical protein GCM10027347_44800 [Larkinella harenae]
MDVFDPERHDATVKTLIEAGILLVKQIQVHASPERLQALRLLNDSLTQLYAYSDRQKRMPGLNETERHLRSHFQRKSKEEVIRFQSLKQYSKNE